jgi:WD40 repeat protein
MVRFINVPSPFNNTHGSMYNHPNPVLYSSTDGLWKNVGRISLSEPNQLPIYSVDCASSLSKAGQCTFACTGSDGCIRIYREFGNISSDLPSYVIDAFVSQAHVSDANCVRWHPTDGTRLASCGDDGLVYLWRYESTF